MESCENKTGIIFPIAVFFDQIDFLQNLQNFLQVLNSVSGEYCLYCLKEGYSNISKIA